MRTSGKNFNYYSVVNLLISLIFLFLLTGCGDKGNDTDSNTTTSQSVSEHFTSSSDNRTENSAPVTFSQYSKADWPTIKRSGVLRIIAPHSFKYNPVTKDKPITYNSELKFIIDFARFHKLKPVFITVKEFSNLIPSLNEGLGDVIVANLNITDARKELINFTIPVTYASEKLIVSQSFTKKLNRKNLGNMKIGVRKQTTYWDTVQKLKQENPELNIVELDDSITEEQKFNKVVSGELDGVIEDSNRLTLFLTQRNDIKAALSLTPERPVGWAVRKNNLELLKHLDEYITSQKLTQYIQDIQLGDLDTIKKNKQLRLITRNNASTYFLWKNQLMGFEYELIREFAKQQKVKLKVLVASDFQEMIQWLEQGYGDIISAGLIKTPEREKLPVLFTQPYLFVQELIVQRQDDKPIKDLTQLQGRSFYVRQSSSYWNTLVKLQEQLKNRNIGFTINTVPETMETEEIIREVIDGKFDLTVADSHIVAIEQSWHSKIQAPMPLSGEQGHRWLVRKNNPKLLAALNKYIKKEYKGLFYNITFNKFFKNSRKLFDADKRDLNDNAISKYDDLIKKLAQEYGFDWRLIAAQVNKESQFDPKAKSWAGARGLLQVMPKTAREMGIKDMHSPENGLRAGVKYMAWLRKQLPDDIPPDVKIWFTLAAYNAGLSHLKDARILAKQQGLDPNRWFDHVEKAFLLLSKPKYHKKARFGYVRGIEPVTYIRQIQVLYHLYSKKFPDKEHS